MLTAAWALAEPSEDRLCTDGERMDCELIKRENRTSSSWLYGEQLTPSQLSLGSSRAIKFRACSDSSNSRGFSFPPNDNAASIEFVEDSDIVRSMIGTVEDVLLPLHDSCLDSSSVRGYLLEHCCLSASSFLCWGSCFSAFSRRAGRQHGSPCCRH